ncbi:hypothetical protein PVK06_035110 [Gossypium arboreum]|uniref:Uncharacterized protein n=1 Tax=Gossypium arboreum TaxID=29729 RepID=A0ABR0NFZ3_GOSAR|nr:hypothetical protein PVK06_035110 [Gossypium arboreum]
MEETSGVTPIQVTQQVDVPVFFCEICSDNHNYEDCPQHAENACYISNIYNNSYGNFYNHSARNQPFWGTQNAGKNVATFIHLLRSYKRERKATACMLRQTKNFTHFKARFSSIANKEGGGQRVKGKEKVV